MKNNVGTDITLTDKNMENNVGTNISIFMTNTFWVMGSKAFIMLLHYYNQ